LWSQSDAGDRTGCAPSLKKSGSQSERMTLTDLIALSDSFQGLPTAPLIKFIKSQTKVEIIFQPNLTEIRNLEIYSGCG
jgi:hypothetical protein